MKCVDIEENAESESILLSNSNAERRKLREQVGFDTPVVLAVNNGYYILIC